MRINGREVMSGTLVIAPGERAELEFPFGRSELEFATDEGQSRVEFVGGKIVFFNMDSPLGVGVAPSVRGADGTMIPLRFALYALGEGTNVSRVIHYTVG